MTLTEMPPHLRVVDETGATEVDGKAVAPGYLIENTRFETLTHVEKGRLAALTPPMLMDLTAQGRDVDHISRVTGYFSRTSGWNRGKRAELKDRARVKLS